VAYSNKGGKEQDCSNMFAATRTQLRRRIVVLSFTEANWHDLVGDC
jgi:hypothetical protein